MTQTLEMNPKQMQKHLLAKIKPHYKQTIAETAVGANVSVRIISYVWEGAVANKKVIKYIIENLQDGWDDNLTITEVEQIKELCQN